MLVGLLDDSCLLLITLVVGAMLDDAVDDCSGQLVSGGYGTHASIG